MDEDTATSSGAMQREFSISPTGTKYIRVMMPALIQLISITSFLLYPWTNFAPPLSL